MERGNRESFFTVQEIAFLYSKKRSARMHTAAYKVEVASDRRRRENVPRHILCSDKHGKHISSSLWQEQNLTIWGIIIEEEKRMRKMI